MDEYEGGLNNGTIDDYTEQDDAAASLISRLFATEERKEKPYFLKAVITRWHRENGVLQFLWVVDGKIQDDVLVDVDNGAVVTTPFEISLAGNLPLPILLGRYGYRRTGAVPESVFHFLRLEVPPPSQRKASPPVEPKARRSRKVVAESSL